ncbi:hypothetical protein [Ideonella paludis]|uniref:hypothetical protein n=1 Tax=Ideonella paludis TaxID=1233411 RepID=UPI00362FB7E6
MRSIQAEAQAPGQMRYQVLIMQSGKQVNPFNGRYELTLIGTLDNKPWTQAMPGGPQPMQVKQYSRLEGLIDHPPQAVVKTVQLRILDGGGAVRATQTLKL